MKKLGLIALFFSSLLSAQSDGLGVWFKLSNDVNWQFGVLNLNKQSLSLTRDPSNGAVTLNVLNAQSADTPNLTLKKTSATSIAVGNCSPTNVCSVAIGEIVKLYPVVIQVTSVTNTAPCTIYFWIDKSNGNIVAGFDSCITAIGSNNIVSAPGTKNFPPRVLKIGTCETAINSVVNCLAYLPYTAAVDYIVPGIGLGSEINTTSGATKFNLAPPQ